MHKMEKWVELGIVAKKEMQMKERIRDTHMEEVQEQIGEWGWMRNQE